MMNLSKQSNLVLVIVLCAVVGVMASISRGNSSRTPEANAIQDVSSLDRRIKLTRTTFLLRRVEYQPASAIRGCAAYRRFHNRASSDREILAIREEIQRLSLRMAELECGVVKLDERTTPATRRNTNGKSNDPCRVNPETSVRLSTHP